ncbi:MAG: polyprenyl synthetase family protein [Flavobacteriales bacterium]|mgnify:FL=1|jgi:geranylgeranyl diphosphate synthase type II|nr:polyprenyl synthetase family protein [Flavobacteriales bacterium]
MILSSQYIDLIQEELKQLHIPDSPDNLYAPISYFLNLKGKKIRPILTLLSAELFNGNINHAKHAALAVEIFHNFTLIHDDIMDEAPLRRGKPTVHEKWNTNIAILSGDVLMIKAYEQLALCPPSALPGLISLFNRTAIEVCEGQQMDMDFETRDQVAHDEYIQMIKLKTSVLLGCALEMGAILCNTSLKNRTEIYQFGVNIGIAFQIQDDILDLYGTGEKVGKQVGGDILANKNTLLSIFAETNANEVQLSELKKLKFEKNAALKINRTKSIFDELEVKSKCNQVMQDYYQKALHHFDAIQTENKNTALLDLTDALMKRDF